MPNSEELRQAGLKTTLPRLKILGILEDAADQHFTAEDVYKRLLDSGEEIGLATVYRVLTQFEGAQLVIRHNFEGGRSVFELNDGKHHDHMVCVKCSKVIEFYNEELERLKVKIANDLGYELVDHHLELFGSPLKKN